MGVASEAKDPRYPDELLKSPFNISLDKMEFRPKSILFRDYQFRIAPVYFIK